MFNETLTVSKKYVMCTVGWILFLNLEIFFGTLSGIMLLDEKET